jgi:hypothetical protein
VKSAKKSTARKRPTPEQKSAKIAQKALKASNAKTAKDAAVTVKAAKKAAKGTKKEPAPFAKPMNLTGAEDDLIRPWICT